MARVLLLVALLACATLCAGGRQLTQATSAIENPFAGTSVAQPPGTSILFQWHAVGTQNYTAQASTQYGNDQAFARLFKGETDALIGIHYFQGAGAGSPTFNQIDGNGNTVGFVVGAKAASLDVPQASDDGGFGSVPDLLLNVVSAGGTLASVTHVQRLNTIGGVVPTGMFTLPGFTDIGNAELAIPYQADYVFLTGGSTSSAGK